MKTERNFWDYESCAVITEQRLRADYDALKAVDDDFNDRHATFESYVEACCSKNGTLQLLRRSGSDRKFRAVLQLMMGYMDDEGPRRSAAAPNVIEEAVYELLYNADVDGLIATRVSDAAFELVSALVDDPTMGRYL